MSDEALTRAVLLHPASGLYQAAAFQRRPGDAESRAMPAASVARVAFLKAHVLDAPRPAGALMGRPASGRLAMLAP